LFAPTDYVLFGGRRGAGKSLTCSNIAASAYEGGKSAIYFTIEMPTRQILHRICSIATGVPINAIRNRNMSIEEWRRVAAWWAQRFEEGEVEYQNYLKHKSFDQFHSDLIRHSLRKTQIDIVYDASLTLGRIRAELDKKCKTLEPAVVIVDYINKVRTSIQSKNGQFEWMEQMAISDKLKLLAQDYNVLLISPYQTDSSGEARMAKGILDPADAAFSLDAHKQEDGIITFNCVKRRNGPELSFTSKVNWATLKVGPESGTLQSDESTGEEAQEI
jgi:replicative DNA helicase